jgi:hypothetical protein
MLCRTIPGGLAATAPIVGGLITDTARVGDYRSSEVRHYCGTDEETGTRLDWTGLGDWGLGTGLYAGGSMPKLWAVRRVAFIAVNRDQSMTGR